MKNKEPKEVDWSKMKPGSKGVTREGSNVEFITCRDGNALFYKQGYAWISRTLYGRFEEGIQHKLDVLCPWEFCVAEGHNPKNLTNKEVGEGWKLIQNCTEPVNPRAECYNGHKLWVPRAGLANCPYYSADTYRIPITKSKRRVPCRPEHFPPGTFVSSTNGDGKSWSVVMYQTQTGHIKCYDVPYSFEELANLPYWRRSVDGGKTWLPCYMEVEE